jgi:hypothetical protein
LPPGSINVPWQPHSIIVAMNVAMCLNGLSSCGCKLQSADQRTPR